MSITVGNSEPRSFTSGDSVSWTRYEADYLPASGWNLVYGFSGPSRFTITTAASGVNHLATMPTTGIKPGAYSWTVKASNGTSNITISSGQATALPNLFAADTELDAAEAQLTLVSAAYNSLTVGGRSSVSVDGVSYTLRMAGELKGALMFARREVDRLRAVRRALLGQSTGAFFRTRFLT